jgi:hypothetical protein
MDFVKARVTIVGSAPLSQSRKHDDPFLEGETADDYDKRTWRSKMNTDVIEGKKTVVLPAFGMQCAFIAAARYSKRQIPGQGKATWTQKFKSGVSVQEPLALNIDPDSVNPIAINANSDGKRGSGSRVIRRLPRIPAGWRCTFEVYILDPIITQDVFREMLTLAGLFIGIGQFRPENGGTNGRFNVEKIEWQDNRQPVSIARSRAA